MNRHSFFYWVSMVGMVIRFASAQHSSSISMVCPYDLAKADYTGCATGSENPASSNPSFETEVLTLVNNERANASVTPLNLHGDLSRAARYHALDMAEDFYFAHDTYDPGPDGPVLACTWSTRISRFYTGTKYHIGENISAGRTSPEQVMNDWMSSPLHRDNILHPDFTDIGIGYIQRTGSEYTHYWVQVFLQGPVLPVELAAFTVREESNTALITWTTASETNNLGFYVQYKESGVFRDLNFIPGQGTSAGQHHYQFQTATLPPGVHVFRLKQVDVDGAWTISAEKTLLIPLPSEICLSSAYPNPCNATCSFYVTAQNSGALVIGLYDCRGRLIRHLFDGPLEKNEPRQIHVEAQSLPSGVYFYRVEGRTLRVQKLVLLR